jgi:hypothetical protein
VGKKITGVDQCVLYPEGSLGTAPVIITNPNWQGEEIYYGSHDN